jgi:hypothetical protein
MRGIGNHPWTARPCSQEQTMPMTRSHDTAVFPFAFSSEAAQALPLCGRMRTSLLLIEVLTHALRWLRRAR